MNYPLTSSRELQQGDRDSTKWHGTGKKPALFWKRAEITIFLDVAASLADEAMGRFLLSVC